jgi:hypothetical protein
MVLREGSLPDGRECSESWTGAKPLAGVHFGSTLPSLEQPILREAGNLSAELAGNVLRFFSDACEHS